MVKQVTTARGGPQPVAAAARSPARAVVRRQVPAPARTRSSAPAGTSPSGCALDSILMARPSPPRRAGTDLQIIQQAGRRRQRCQHREVPGAPSRAAAQRAAASCRSSCVGAPSAPQNALRNSHSALSRPSTGRFSLQGVGAFPLVDTLSVRGEDSPGTIRPARRLGASAGRAALAAAGAVRPAPRPAV